MLFIIFFEFRQFIHFFFYTLTILLICLNEILDYFTLYIKFLCYNIFTLFNFYQLLYEHIHLLYFVFIFILCYNYCRQWKVCLFLICKLFSKTLNNHKTLFIYISTTKEIWLIHHSNKTNTWNWWNKWKENSYRVCITLFWSFYICIKFIQILSCY